MATFTVTLTYPDNIQVDLRDTLCLEFGYQDQIEGLPNPQTKNQFLQIQMSSFLKNWLKNTYKQAKIRQFSAPEIDIQ